MEPVEESNSVVDQLIEIMKEICGFPECRNTSKNMYWNLVRRLKLLSPFFDDLKDIEEGLGDEEVQALVFLKTALEMAMELLRSVNEGSKIYQALQMEEIADKFHEVTEQIEKALSEISYDKLYLSEEVQEQIELVHAQFRRAKGRTDSPDLELYTDLMIARKEKIPNLAILTGLAEKLQLKTINDLKKESIALHEMVISSSGCPWDRLEEMSALLKKLKDLVVTGNPESDTSESEKSLVNHRSLTIPNDFQCPISLDLMEDPVIVSTGQTYERSSIQKWLDAGHKTCPKTQQILSHTVLTPNFVLKGLIAQWCENNHIELPTKQGSCRNRNSSSGLSDCDLIAIEILLQKLSNGNLEEQRAAAGELRLLAKRDADNRICIADAGAIPLLVELLSSSDPKTQEHAVTALLNLSINETNKGSIVIAGGIPDIVDVLKNGSMEARENAAATLFSLSVIDENKVAIGAAGALPALIDLLCQGSPRGKKDAATAIFNLSIYQGNKVRAVRAGIVVPLMRMLMDAGSGMVDEALAIMAILASHQEGKVAIGQANPIPIYVDMIKTGSPRNRENAAAVLWSLSTGNVQHLKTAGELGAEAALKELSENGTDRAKRKARNLLELFHRTADMVVKPSN
ncbi:hypothetical protein HHK36_018166 [Tetracentron sinense]|uniref:U-box domain-containing protein 12 n=1 Tax=Tetracentron sinense TaxID=13715 RepID=A0A835DD97_TETSI|nr:hypothetical protein HHK36_018166 [Tetracentron sinense]